MVAFIRLARRPVDEPVSCPRGDEVDVATGEHKGRVKFGFRGRIKQLSGCH